MSRDKRYVIHPRNWQVRPPLFPGIVLWLLMDRFHTPEWAYGVISVLLLLWFVVWIHDMATNEEMDVIQEIKNLKSK